MSEETTVYWTKERCCADAQQYQSRTEWARRSNAYQAARRNGWIEDCCRHMGASKPRRRRWTKEACLINARRYQSRFSWRRENKGAWHAAYTNGWLDECFAHMNDSETAAKWTKATCAADAALYEARSAWSKASPGAYHAAVRNGWFDYCTRHMPKRKRKWTKERCMEDARQYESRSMWQKNSPVGYLTAGQQGWLEECCAHMELRQGRVLTKEECLADAKKYQRKSDWLRDSGFVYRYAKAKGWFEECSRHMSSRKKVG